MMWYQSKFVCLY